MTSSLRLAENSMMSVLPPSNFVTSLISMAIFSCTRGCLHSIKKNHERVFAEVSFPAIRKLRIMSLRYLSVMFSGSFSLANINLDNISSLLFYTFIQEGKKDSKHNSALTIKFNKVHLFSKRTIEICLHLLACFSSAPSCGESAGTQSHQSI